MLGGRGGGLGLWVQGLTWVGYDGGEQCPGGSGGLGLCRGTAARLSSGHLLAPCVWHPCGLPAPPAAEPTPAFALSIPQGAPQTSLWSQGLIAAGNRGRVLLDHEDLGPESPASYGPAWSFP